MSACCTRLYIWDQCSFFATDEVPVELLSGLAGQGEHIRRMGSRVVHGLLASRDTVVLPQPRASFTAGLELYEARLDKSYSLTDCTSMCAMRQHRLMDVLTNDAHFGQEGFNVLIPLR